MEKKNKSNGMVDLFPREIILDILSRLPSEAVLQCKLVCKSWRNLLRSCKHFPYMHLQQQHLDDSKVSYILTCARSGDAYRTFQLYYGEYTCNSNANTINTVVQIHHPPCSFLFTYADKQKNLYLS